jgi:GNAT superfamily N-acetyltransferase
MNPPERPLPAPSMSGPSGTVRLVAADLDVHRAALVELNVEYLTWLEQVCEELFGFRLRDLLGTDVRTYTERSLDALVRASQRGGSFYLVEVDGAAAGMGGLRRFGDGVAEVKRMFVRPVHRGRRLGATLLAQLVADARALGYGEVRLDTGSFMTAAHRTYEAAGFVDRDPYEGAEVPQEMWPDWRFMELSLG